MHEEVKSNSLKTLLTRLGIDPHTASINAHRDVQIIEVRENENDRCTQNRERSVKVKQGMKIFDICLKLY